MIELIIKIVILLAIMILAYMFLFWVIKQISPIFEEYDCKDKEEKMETIVAFVLCSSFIIAPCIFIFYSLAGLLKIVT